MLFFCNRQILFQPIVCNMKRLLLFPFLILLLALILPSCTPQDNAEILTFDQKTQQQPVIRHSQLDSVLASLEAVPFKKLDTDYMHFAGIEGSWKKSLSATNWYKIAGDQAYLFVVGRFRLREFMAHDPFVSNPMLDMEEQDHQYLCIDQKVLHKLLDLLLWMDKNGYDTQQVTINYGYRHPSLNKRAHGAPKSRHQWGQAIDLLIGDVNHDGKKDEEDKKPLIKVLETTIIGNKGGVGRYPGSPVIHMDVRGHKARWDHQTTAL
jgi:hypothetical protein